MRQSAFIGCSHATLWRLHREERWRLLRQVAHSFRQADPERLSDRQARALWRVWTDHPVEQAGGGRQQHSRSETRRKRIAQHLGATAAFWGCVVF